MKPLTYTEAMAVLEALESSGDTEAVHVEADKAIVGFLMMVNPEMAAQWIKLDKSHGGFWYA